MVPIRLKWSEEGFFTAPVTLSLSPFRVVKIEKWPRRDWIVKASRGDASACASAVYLVIREALQERYFHLVLGSYRSNVVGVGGYKTQNTQIHMLANRMTYIVASYF